jgi:DNA-binding IclR family transcriptional regulator
MARTRKAADDNDGAARTALKGVRRTLEILEYLAVQPARATDVEAALGLSWATVHRTLDQLEQGGFVVRHPDTSRYSIGPRMWFVGTSYLATHPVLDVAQPYLEVAIPGIDFTVQLVERSGRLAVVLYSHHASGKVITKAAYGYHFPLHTGSKGQVLLAYAEPDDIARYLDGPLERLTAETVADPAAIRATLERIRTLGYARTEGDVQPFTGSLAAPVFNRQNEVVASVCFIFRRSLLRERASEEKLREALLMAANAISMALGWRPPVRLLVEAKRKADATS